MQFPSATSGSTLWVYTLSSIVLILNLLMLWVTSGARRARSGVAINAEDGARYGAPVSDSDPPEVARLLRIHRNAEASIYPFLLLGLVYVLLQGPARVATPIFVTFVLARLAHSIVYIRALQPWRTITFAASLLMILALIVAILLQLLAH
jgi:uncharacterized MAPEG superfamily protein